ncbi:MAG: Spy/CpxP family protein refolding chaperone [Pyrinomonadaceae bacterium]
MSLKTRFISITTMAVSLVVFSTFAMAQDTKGTTPKTQDGVTKPDKGDRKARRLAGGKHGDMRGARLGRMGGFGRGFGSLRGITLTDAQKARIKSIHEANKPDGAIMDQMKALKAARKAGTPITDEQKAAFKSLRKQSQVKAKSVHEQVLAVLTAEQRAQLEQRTNEIKQRRDEFRQQRQELRKNRPNRGPATAAPVKKTVTD